MGSSSSSVTQNERPLVTGADLANQKSDASSLSDAELEIFKNPNRMFESYFQALLPNQRPETNFLKALCWIINGTGELTDYQTVQTKFEEYRKSCTHLTVKLIISQLIDEPNAITKAVASFATPFGAVHLALQIGPWIVDWSKREICQPKSFRALKAKTICVLDLKSKLLMNEENLKKVCQVCTFWNTTMNYSCLSHKHETAMKNKNGSCQAFVDDMLYNLGIQQWWKKDGIIAKYLAQVKAGSNPRNLFKEYEFNSHGDLDAFWVAFYETKKNLIDPEEYELIRSIDRAFWLSGDQPIDCPLVSATIDPVTWEEVVPTDNPLFVLRSG